MYDVTRVTGWVQIRLYDPDGRVRARRLVRNLATAAGDAAMARAWAAGVYPANAAAGDPLDGIQVGNGAAAAGNPAKTGAGAALGAFVGGANFDPGYPVVAAAAVTYLVTLGPGTATGTGINEAVLCVGSTAPAAAPAAGTYARVVFAAFDKAAGQTVTLRWSQTFQG